MDPYQFKPGLTLFIVVGVYFMFVTTLAVALGLLFIGAVYCFERYEMFLRDQLEQKSYDTNIVAIQNQLDEIKKNHEQVIKTSEDTKKLLSQANLSKAMGKNPRLS